MDRVCEHLNFGPGGERGPVNDMVRHTMERTGANVMGKRVFHQGEVSRPEEALFHQMEPGPLRPDVSVNRTKARSVPRWQPGSRSRLPG